MPNCTATAFWNTTLARFVIHPKDKNISKFDVYIGGYFAYVEEEGYWDHG